MDYMHAISLKASYTIAQCFRDLDSTRLHAYNVVYGVPFPTRIMLEVVSIVQRLRELQSHCHELRTRSLAQSV
jgi:hypothetical protein